jgi:hypothetical protein
MIPDAEIHQSLKAYLERLDPPRRKYSEAYLAWRAGGERGDPPRPVGLNNGQWVALRNRLDGLLKGDTTYPPPTGPR